MRSMTIISATLSVIMLAGLASAGVPDMIYYQGYLTDADGEALSGTFVMFFTIYESPTIEDDSVWQEMKTLDVTNGMFETLLGNINPLTDNIFSDTGRYLGIRIGDPTEPEISPRTRLVSTPYAHRVSTIDGASAGAINGNLSLYDDGNLRSKLYVQGYGQLQLLDFPDGDITVDLSAGMANGGKLLLYQEDGATSGALLMGGSTSSGASLTMHNAAGETTIKLDALDDIEEGDDGARLTLFDGISAAITMNAMEINTSGAAYYMSVGNDTTVKIHANGDYGDGGGIIRLYDDDVTKTVHIDAHGATYGGAQVSLNDHDGTTTISMDAESGSVGGARITLTNGAEPAITTVVIDAQEGSSGGADLSLRNDAGVETICLDANYEASGYGRVITSVLEITGGSDLSEQFDISDCGVKPEPGMVVCIDPANSGGLIVSNKAYDPCVAGIISGAGGIKPGMLMGQDGSVSDGQHAVALTGRVYCRSDAKYGSIRPGDLITTSDTPGHAMRVSDPRKAHGATIGKAMSSLAEGQGLILVLVGLQ